MQLLIIFKCNKCTLNLYFNSYLIKILHYLIIFKVYINNDY